ncbi:MAG: type VI secretion system transmembrane protein TssO [Bacteroidales bacterium]|nr:type VI secretion system transmembrane protein TssO [Bacteroidales bacterium]
MAGQNSNEAFWRKIKFILIFVLCGILIYVAQTKFMIKVPVVDNHELLEAIDGYESIINEQKMYSEQIKKVYQEIEDMEFDIHQVQKKDDIKKQIFNIRSIYKENEMNSKFLFGIQSANILQIYFETREEHSSLIKNKKLIVDNLSKCKANI